MTGDQFLQTLIRFSSRRGKPNLMVTDNGKNFVFVQPLLGKKVDLNDPKLKDYVQQNGINWHFVAAYSPWKAGAYKRLIGAVKNSLLKVIGSRIVDYST